MQKTVAKIYLENIRNNAKAFKALTGVPICAVVKADAYGHGAEEVALALQSEVGLFAVSLLDEALAIRVAVCGKDILVLTPPLDDSDIATGGYNAFILTVGDLYTANKVAKFARNRQIPVRVHLKVNTGMNRYGMNLQTLGKACALFAKTPLVRVEGVYSHLHGSTLATAEKQRLEFVRAVKICRGYFPSIKSHLSATYGALLGQKFAFDFVRIGIGLYGYLPDGAQGIACAPTLKKGMEVYAIVATNRKFTGGVTGYGEQIQTRNGENLAILRVGYADGFLRKKDNGTCNANDNANNLCMDACLRFGEYRRGEFVPIMTNALETAKTTGTIPYEVLCASTRRAHKIYMDLETE